MESVGQAAVVVKVAGVVDGVSVIISKALSFAIVGY